MDDVPNLLEAIRAARGWTQDQLAESLETTQATVSRWLGGREPKGRNLQRIRELALETGIVERALQGSNQAPLMGRIGAGAEILVDFEQTPPEGYDTVELPFSYPDPVIAFEVVGDSQLPVYEPGEIIVCLRDQRKATESFIGDRAAVRTNENKRYLKRVARGPSRGTYNLESWNARTIEAVRIAWVGEIIGTVRPNAIRRILRPHRPAAGRAKKGGGRS